MTGAAAAVPVAGGAGRTAVAPPTRRGSSGPFAALLAALFGPSGRRALAFAAVVVVGVGVWMARRPREDVVRGEGPGAFRVSVSTVRGEIALAWPRVAGADSYRVTLLGADLGAIARFDLGDVTTWHLGRDALPARLAPGAAISVEVEALQKGAVLSTTPARAIRLP